MKYLPVQILGFVMLVFGLQGAIRLLSNENDPGVLAGLPGDIGLKMAVYVVVSVAGGYLTSWAYKKTRSK